MVLCRVIFALMLLVFSGASGGALAGSKKAAPPARPKAIYEAPMSVVIVRSADTACEPLCPEWISAEGEITGNTPAQFRRVFKQIGDRKLPIVIRSPGGSINAAVEIGRMIRQRKLDVGVGYTNYKGCSPDQKTCKLPQEDGGKYRGTVDTWMAFCASACPLILASGVNRHASYGTYVGVHKPKTTWVQRRYMYRERYRMVKGKKKVIERKITKWLPNKTSVSYGYDKTLRKSLTAYLVSMGVKPELISESEKTAYKDISELTEKQLDDFRLRTTVLSMRSLTENVDCSKAGNCVKIALVPPKVPAEPDAEILMPGVGPNDPPMRFALVRDSRRNCEPLCPEWIVADGVITKDTPAAFDQIVGYLGPRRPLLVLNSQGGELDAAIQLGRLIRANGFNTAVAETHVRGDFSPSTRLAAEFTTSPRNGFAFHYGECRGACVFALAGGVARDLGRSGHLVLYAPDQYSSRMKMAPAAIIFSYLTDMGIPKALIDAMWKVADARGMPVEASEAAVWGLGEGKRMMDYELSPQACGMGVSEICIRR